jgi:hypothetical protein
MSKPKVIIIKNIVAEYLPGYENVKEFMGLFNKYFVYEYKNPDEGNPHQQKLMAYLSENLDNEYSTKEGMTKARKFVKEFNTLQSLQLKLNKKKGINPRLLENVRIKEITYRPMARVLSTLGVKSAHKAIESIRKMKDSEFSRISQEREAERKREREEKEKRSQSDRRQQVIELPKDTPPKLQKLFNDYISDIHPKIFNLDYYPDDLFIGSIDFRIDYPKLYKYLDKHLSVTEDEKVKLFKLFNRLDDKIQALIGTNYDKLRFITLLPYYSVLVGREETKRMKPRGNTHVVKKLNIDTFAKAARKFNSFFNFATNEMLGGIYNDYPQFLVLYSKYLKSFYTRSSSKSPTTLKLSYDKLYDFVIRWRYRDSIPGTQYVNVENYKFGKEYTDLVEFLKKFLKDTPKKGRKSLINNVNSITDKLTLFTGQDMTGSRRDHFAFLALQLIVYAPFADAYSPPKLSRKNYALA